MKSSTQVDSVECLTLTLTWLRIVLYQKMSHPILARRMMSLTHSRRLPHNRTHPWLMQAEPHSTLQITRFPCIRISSPTAVISHMKELALEGHQRRSNNRTLRTPTLYSSHSQAKRKRLLHQQLLSATCQWQTSSTMRLAVIRAIMERMKKVNHHLVVMVKTTVRKMRAKRAHSLTTITRVKKFSSTMVNSSSNTEDSYLKAYLSNNKCQLIDMFTHSQCHHSQCPRTMVSKIVALAIRAATHARCMARIQMVTIISNSISSNTTTTWIWCHHSSSKTPPSSQRTTMGKLMNHQTTGLDHQCSRATVLCIRWTSIESTTRSSSNSSWSLKINRTHSSRPCLKTRKEMTVWALKISSLPPTTTCTNTCKLTLWEWVRVRRKIRETRFQIQCQYQGTPQATL